MARPKKVQCAAVDTIVVGSSSQYVLNDQKVSTIPIPCGIVPGCVEISISTASRRADAKELRVAGVSEGKIVQNHTITVNCIIGGKKRWNNLETDLLGGDAWVNDEERPDYNKDYRNLKVVAKKIQQEFRHEIGGKFPAAVLKKILKEYAKALTYIPLRERLTEKQIEKRHLAEKKAEEAAKASEINRGDRVAVFDGRSGNQVDCIVQKVNKTSFIVRRENETEEEKNFRVVKARVIKLAIQTKKAA
jgi:hypothetical protein